MFVAAWDERTRGGSLRPDKEANWLSGHVGEFVALQTGGGDQGVHRTR
jgi:hypothetical protein